MVGPITGEACTQALWWAASKHKRSQSRRVRLKTVAPLIHCIPTSFGGASLTLR